MAHTRLRSVHQEYGIGKYVASEAHALTMPRTRETVRACLFADGFSQSADEQIGVGATVPPITNNAGHIVRGIAQSGLGVMGGDLGLHAAPSSWGNATGVSRVGSLHTYAKSRIYNDNAMVAAAISMGANNILNFAKANPTYFQAIALIVPALDMQDIWDNDRASLKAFINSAHGGRPSDANNPADNPGSFDMPICIWYSQTDTICIASILEAWAAAVGSNVELRDIGNGGHDVSPVDGLEVGRWLRQYI